MIDGLQFQITTKTKKILIKINHFLSQRVRFLQSQDLGWNNSLFYRIQKYLDNKFEDKKKFYYIKKN